MWLLSSIQDSQSKSLTYILLHYTRAPVRLQSCVKEMDSIGDWPVKYIIRPRIWCLWLFCLIILYLVALPFQRKGQVALPPPIVWTFRKMRIRLLCFARTVHVFFSAHTGQQFEFVNQQGPAFFPECPDKFPPCASSRKEWRRAFSGSRRSLYKSLTGSVHICKPCNSTWPTNRQTQTRRGIRRSKRAPRKEAFQRWQEKLQEKLPSTLPSVKNGRRISKLPSDGVFVDQLSFLRLLVQILIFAPSFDRRLRNNRWA